MKAIILPLSILIFLFQVNTALAFTFWKTCIKYDSSFSHHIVDTNTMAISNSKYIAGAVVQCISMESRHAFSFYENGTPLHPDSSITFSDKDKGELCQGDIILVYDDECAIISMNKTKRDSPELKNVAEGEDNQTFILWKVLKDQQERLKKIN